ncbi:hypothetical protein [Enterococcus asini]|uniref:hypothetical protein n=1 Tax=Enterococcus asini TaxID=57732 RepID=UPI00398AD956
MLELPPKREYVDILENAIIMASYVVWIFRKSTSYMSIRWKSMGLILASDMIIAMSPLNVKKWFNCDCCPPNLARLIGSVGDSFTTESSEGMYINLSIPERCRYLKVGHRTVTMLPYFLWGNRGTGELRVWLNHFFTSK